VITAWGELALLTDKHDPEWAGYREAIFKYLHAYDANDKPTPGLETGSWRIRRFSRSIRTAVDPDR
jgi:hypothetical protein